MPKHLLVDRYLAFLIKKNCVSPHSLNCLDSLAVNFNRRKVYETESHSFPAEFTSCC